MTTAPLTDQQLADTCGTCHGRDFKRCPACLGTGIKPNPLAWMRFWQLLDEMEPARLRYRRALRRAEATSTDSPEFDSARGKGDAALAEIEQLMRGWIAANPAADDPRNAELTRRRADDLNIRGALAPADGPRQVPMPLGDSVTPAVEWLLADRDRLRAKVTEERAVNKHLVEKHQATLAVTDEWMDERAQLLADNLRLSAELKQAGPALCADCGHVEAAHSEDGDRDCTASGARVTSCSCSYFIPSA